jgi:hypothetical protein
MVNLMSEPIKAERELNEAASTANAPVRTKILIVEGIREDGTKFRPSDWPERISSIFAVFGKDQRLRYALGVQPRIFNGAKVLAVEPMLRERDPVMFETVMKFARDNNLRTRETDDLSD